MPGCGAGQSCVCGCHCPGLQEALRRKDAIIRVRNAQISSLWDELHTRQPWRNALGDDGKPIVFAGPAENVTSKALVVLGINTVRAPLSVRPVIAKATSLLLPFSAVGSLPSYASISKSLRGMQSPADAHAPVQSSFALCCCLAMQDWSRGKLASIAALSRCSSKDCCCAGAQCAPEEGQPQEHVGPHRRSSQENGG